jgi:hypothetical protein
VTESQNSAVIKGNVIVSLNGKPTHDMLNAEIDVTLSKPLTAAYIDCGGELGAIIGRCIVTNGFYAARLTTRLTVVQSTTTRYRLGHAVTTINGSITGIMTQEQIDDILSTTIISVEISSRAAYKAAVRREPVENQAGRSHTARSVACKTYPVIN